jgi:hypothetical protein
MKHAVKLWLFLAIASGALALALATVNVHAGVAAGSMPADAMASAAKAFLASLSAEQRAKASFGMDDEHRVQWYFVPRARDGVSLKAISAAQRERALELLRAGLSAKGHSKALRIIELERVLAEIENDSVKRDHELYYVSIFGTPSPSGTWAWKFEGHHLSINVTVVKGAMFSSTPAFWGANPAEVPSGALKGRRALAAEEDLARRLVTSLDAKQRALAVFDDGAPADILTGAKAQVSPLERKGIAWKALSPVQAKLVREIIDEHISGMAPPLAQARSARVDKAGLADVHFAWAGGTARGQGHYYRIQGPTFLIEYDNTQNGANHVHTVWRDFDGDFGRDLLREHLRAAH